MAKPKPAFIIGAIVGVVIIATAVVVPWYYLVYQNRPSEYPTWDLMFFGNTVDQSVNVTYEDIREEFNVTTFHFNQTKWWTPDGYESVIANFTGVSLWDIIQFSGVDYGTANALRFVASDNWESPILSLDDVENNKSLIIVYYIEEETLLSGPAEGGNGYLMSAVNYSVNEGIKSSHFNLKWLVGVEFIIDWNLELFGSDSLVEENKSINFYELYNEETLVRHENVLINYTEPGNYSELRNVSGVTLWSVIQYLEFNYTTATGIRFHTEGGWLSMNITLADVEVEADKILIVYKEDGEFLNPDPDEGDGYLFSLVDFSLTDPDSSSQFCANFLDGIEFLIL